MRDTSKHNNQQRGNQINKWNKYTKKKERRDSNFRRRNILHTYFDKHLTDVVLIQHLWLGQMIILILLYLIRLKQIYVIGCSSRLSTLTHPWISTSSDQPKSNLIAFSLALSWCDNHIKMTASCRSVSRETVWLCFHSQSTRW